MAGIGERQLTGDLILKRCRCAIYYIYSIEGRTMPTSASSLLLKFRSKDTQFGVTRKTVKQIALQFDLSETEVIHMALSRLAKEELPAYEPDAGALTARELQAVRKIAAAGLPTGKVLSKRSLF